MIKQIRAALLKICRTYGGDSRTQLCRVEADDLVNGRCRLKGTILDAETLMAVTQSLNHQFPGITFDMAAVQVLRQSPPKLLTVSTNLAGFHRQPSRTAERVSEVLNGEVLEQLQEQHSWVRARQRDGYLGWVYRPYLSESPPLPPTHMVAEPVSLMRAEPGLRASLVSRVMAGTKVVVTAVNNSWAHLILAGERGGWVPLADIRALDDLPRDEDGRRRQMMQDARGYTGVPYLWGGCSALGIDCSGLVQLLHRLVGVAIPRDADMQFDAGKPVERPFQPGDLLFFGSDQGHRSISHVAMSLGGWQVIHSSGPRNGVYEDDVQAVSWLQDAFLGARSFISDPNED